MNGARATSLILFSTFFPTALIKSFCTLLEGLFSGTSSFKNVRRNVVLGGFEVPKGKLLVNRRRNNYNPPKLSKKLRHGKDKMIQQNRTPAEEKRKA
ncbi:hypothetical protein Avbf_13460 [Armadillidium vulgare]|nr:hypothetical protein Avbf_13460 [Armadillidium vulgare]